ncbi:MAG: DUF2752 domain-containing protein [Chloroflexia bacterium]|nr:DUF2752 domain-containing protein [Chloroflexia bacterium]
MNDAIYQYTNFKYTNSLTRNKLYIFLFSACIAAYSWLFIDFAYLQPYDKDSTSPCIIKNVTGVPCPSCGSTRAIVALFNGDLVGSLHWNPIGLLLSLILIITPFWITYDVVLKRDSLLNFYRKSEKFIRKWYIAIPAIGLIIANWIWNICKGL